MCQTCEKLEKHLSVQNTVIDDKFQAIQDELTEKVLSILKLPNDLKKQSDLLQS